MAGLPREVLKWTQSLDLSWKIKVPKWDLTNGYLVGEILSKYFPGEINLYYFCNCSSLEIKLENWRMLRQFLGAKHLEVPEVLIEGTIHTREGAAGQLLEHLFSLLTHRLVKKIPPEVEPDNTDNPYQVRLPMHARCTASTSVKTNLRLTEVLCDPSIQATALKSQKIINAHIDHRHRERQEDPDRFGIRPTLGERCERHWPAVHTSSIVPSKGESLINASVTNLHSEYSSSLSHKPNLLEVLQ